MDLLDLSEHRVIIEVSYIFFVCVEIKYFVEKILADYQLLRQRSPFDDSDDVYLAFSGMPST